MFVFLALIRKNRCEIYKKMLDLSFTKYLIVTFSLGLSTKINNPVPAIQVRFQQFRVNERFCVEGNKRSDRGAI